MLSVIIASLTALAVLSLLWPFARAGRTPVRAASATDLYRVQIAEIRRDAARGLVSAAEAEGAEAEAARRLLAAAEAKPAAQLTPAQLTPAQLTPAPTPARKPTRWSGWLAGLAILVFVPGFSLALYLRLGKPELPDAPLTARLAVPPAQTDVAAAVTKIEAHLKQNPDDVRGWEVIAPVYLRLGRAHEAALAYAAVLRLGGSTPDLQSRFGEALVYAAQGTVTAPARKAFEQALADDPSHVKARFYTGLAAEQDGDFTKAREIWGKIAAEEPEGSPLTKALRQRMEAMSAPPRQGGAALAALPEAERASAIRGMVERLAARLAADGRDLDGWLRLVRAYAVMNEREKALAALAEARRNLAHDVGSARLPDDGSARLHDDGSARLDALARELGLETKGGS